MNIRIESLQRIKDSLTQLGSDQPLKQGAESLLNTLGYSSSRTVNVGSVTQFIERFSEEGKLTETRRNLLSSCKQIEMLFQFTASELTKQVDLPEGLRFDAGRVESFLFFAIDIEGGVHPRMVLSEIARSVNSLFAMPVIVLFRHGSTFTIAVVHRRPNRKNEDRDVLEKVTLAKDIRMENPHRAHTQFLSSLDLAVMIESGIRSFDDLHERWEEALDVEALNKRFYRELFEWFELAVASCQFPNDGAGAGNKERHVIRLITRLLFIWFLKEKRLIPSSLFDEGFVSSALRKHDRQSSDYYRAVLQNLFFATLNTEIHRRTFVNGQSSDVDESSMYHYQALMEDSAALVRQFGNVPFVNGGLFDCLDSSARDKKEDRFVDVFDDDTASRDVLNVPAHLFFGEDHGLYPLLSRYKFTVEENTPLDREVALDPELLGSVFENLLAAYNPETRQIARKKTGSYYTPREVVDYMVHSSLSEAIAAKTTPGDGDREFWRERIQYLLDQSDAMADADELFDDTERRSIVSAIAELRTIDPAVGSGAFPMGILQTLTLGLRRLDANNELWEEEQKQRAKDRIGDAFDIDDRFVRDETLKEISATFENYRESDFGRKLYLIQNAIYGVDIQPIACQIARLRFFISLAIEQEVTEDSAANYGIKPLPNLETKFIAADSLLSVGEERTIAEEGVRKIIDALKLNRERYFNATTLVAKRACRENDEHIRRELARSLAEAGFGDKYIEKVAKWNPYDQNSLAEWFEPRYMFGVEKFDVVIGNPPYIQLQRNDGELRKKYEGLGYKFLASKGDVYLLFIESGMKITCDCNGILAYITSNSWLKADYGSRLREYLALHHTPLQLVELGKDVFENAIVDSAVFVIRNGKHNFVSCEALDTDQLPGIDFPPPRKDWGRLKSGGRKPWMVLSSIENRILEKIEAVGIELKLWDISIYRGVVTGFNPAFIVDQETRDRLVDDDPGSSKILKPVLRGRDVKRYHYNWSDLWLISTLPAWKLDIDHYPAIRDYLLQFGEDRLQQEGLTLPDGRKSRSKTRYKWFELQSTCAYHSSFADRKVVWIELVNKGRFAFDDEGLFIEATAFMMIGERLKYLCAFLNSDLAYWYIYHSAPTSGMGRLRWKKTYIEHLPVVIPSTATETKISQLVDEARLVSKSDVQRLNEIESAINSTIFELYDLSAEEASIVTSLTVA